ncbi:MAG TPA: hypothetical protein VE913_15930, partial [Longimicrobium sp.]|nr:hypothetical protein [Longimicrobium sp.]
MEKEPPPRRALATRVWARENRSTTIAIATGVLYGLVARVVFGTSGPDDLFRAMATSFIFFVPVAIGFITVWLADEKRRGSWAYAIMGPWITTLLTLAAAFVLAYEGMICAVLILPAFMVMGSLGGLAAAALCKAIFRRRRIHAFALGAILLLPFAASPVEERMVGTTEYRTVENRIRIHAEPARVWEQIARVPPIRPEEYGTSFVHRIGFPRPLEATL